MDLLVLFEVPQVWTQQGRHLVIIVMKQLSLAELIWITSPLCNPDSPNEETFNVFPWAAPVFATSSRRTLINLNRPSDKHPL